MAFEAVFGGFGLLFYILFGVKVLFWGSGKVLAASFHQVANPETEDTQLQGEGTCRPVATTGFV